MPPFHFQQFTDVGLIEGLLPRPLAVRKVIRIPENRLNLEGIVREWTTCFRSRCPGLDELRAGPRATAMNPISRQLRVECQRRVLLGLRSASKAMELAVPIGGRYVNFLSTLNGTP